MKPLIGISTQGREIATSLGDHQQGETISREYVDGVLAAGGIPVLLPRQSPDNVAAALDAVDGLLLSGGGDVDPALYNGNQELSEWVDPVRDAWELALALEAGDRQMPLLAVCRGLQVVNVAFGGTLVEDIPTMIETAEVHRVVDERAHAGHQPVNIEEGTRIAAALGTSASANCIHHQAVRVIAPGYRPVAWSTDGVIEGFETTNPDWDMMAIQWHPEYLQHSQLAVFESLVASAATRRSALA